MEKVEHCVIGNEYVGVTAGQYAMKELPGPFNAAAESFGEILRSPPAPASEGRKLLESDFGYARGFDFADRSDVYGIHHSLPFWRPLLPGSGAFRFKTVLQLLTIFPYRVYFLVPLSQTHQD